MSDLFGFILSNITAYPEFWSAIGGALGGTIGGGLIAYLIQLKALRETRRYREQDHRRSQQHLANSLLVKMIQLHSNFRGFHKHFEDSFAKETNSKGNRESWQFVLPIANIPNPIHFSSDELSMLLAMKDNHVFNAILPMDTVHNSLLEAANTFTTQRTLLTDRLPIERTDSSSVGGTLTPEQLQTIRPQMIIVNQLVEQIRVFADSGFNESKTALHALHSLIQNRLDVTYELQFIEPD